MAAPDVSTTTRRIWESLPQAYRDGDEDQADGADGYPLLRFLSLLGDQAGEIEALLDRVNYVPQREAGAAGDTSDLANPETADPAWLPWLAMHTGVDVSGMSASEARAAIAAERFVAGSHDQLLEVIKFRLSGDQRAVLIPNLDDDEWLLGVAVHPDDLNTVSWLALEAGFPNWAAIEAAGSWEDLGDIDPLATPSVRRSKPAGVELVYLEPGSWAGIESLGSWAAIEALGDWASLETSPF